jgi:hypothetical protein
MREACRPPLLSAVFAEWRRGKQEYLLGTRLWVVVEFLRAQCPQVREFVESKMDHKIVSDGPTPLEGRP